jgi:hypothetical protein
MPVMTASTLLMPSMPSLATAVARMVVAALVLMVMLLLPSTLLSKSSNPQPVHSLARLLSLLLMAGPIPAVTSLLQLMLLVVLELRLWLFHTSPL